ncbi:MAG TPA: hypothetical protein VMV34_06715 [Terriglobia bacterium]|nr:hypothetical protein [Terriglobia bacterium]
MNQYETALLVAFIIFFLAAFGLHHLITFKVNKRLPPGSRIPHRLSVGRWNRLATKYKEFYPNSSLYQFALSSAVTAFILAFAMLGFRFWEYFSSR